MPVYKSTDVSYTMVLKSPSGRMLVPSIPFVSADWARVVNDVSSLTLVCPTEGIHEQMLGPDFQIEIWRKVGSGMAELEGDTTWLVRQRSYVFQDDGQRFWQIVAPDANIILQARIVAAHDGTSQAAKTGVADDVMKEIVEEQFGATASGTRNISAYLSIQGDTSLGPSIQKAFAYQNVMDVLKDLAQTSYTLGTPIYFDIVLNSQTMEFQTFKNQRGVDRRISSNRRLIIGPAYKNVGAFTITEDYMEEANFIYAMGPSVYGARLVATAEDTSRSQLSPFSRREKIIDNSSNDASATALTRSAQAELFASRPRILAEGDMRVTPDCIYGVHWRFGDRMTFERDKDFQIDVRVDAASVSVSEGVESVSGHFRSDDA